MFKIIECSQIDFENTDFLMSYPLEAPTVIASVATVGVVQPIIVTGCLCQGKYQIISGFRRAYACRELELPAIHANIYPLEADNRLSAFCLALYENLAHRRFNDAEKALILSKLATQFDCSQDELLQTYLPALQLAPNAKVLDIYLKLMDFDDELRHYIATHEVPMTILELLTSLTSQDRKAVFSLISNLKLGVNKLKELLVFLEEIALRDESTIHDLLHVPQIIEILQYDKYTGPQKTEQIRHWIRAQRYPQFTELEQNYQQQRQKLKVSPKIQLKTDRFFEDNTLTASFRFQTPEALRTTAEELLQISQQPELGQLLTLIQGKG